MGRIGGFIVCFALLFCVGCTELGMNKKLAMADSLSVATTGATLDEAQDFEKTRSKVIEVALGLKAFVTTGGLGALPLEDVRTALENFMIEKGWSNYAYLVDTALTYVKQQSVDTSIIGDNNVLLIETSLDGIIRQAARSKVDWSAPLFE